MKPFARFALTGLLMLLAAHGAAQETRTESLRAGGLERRYVLHLPEGLPAYHHIGLYAYRAGFLKAFPALERAPIEAFESLEQLRALWHGYAIRVIVLKENLPAGVDTKEDLERVRKIFSRQSSTSC